MVEHLSPIDLAYDASEQASSAGGHAAIRRDRSEQARGSVEVADNAVPCHVNGRALA